MCIIRVIYLSCFIAVLFIAIFKITNNSTFCTKHRNHNDSIKNEFSNKNKLFQTKRKCYGSAMKGTSSRIGESTKEKVKKMFIEEPDTSVI